ncbi:hypothetical protein PR048_032057 [Dryococelus australis]|uniref:Uncharacterized protein n=1 Tax=Dryococelus australis TaxID=614101 RepID=A0ABQ9G149_9NEOP|nr:hypothetical protein PR048_032057 [Dryococelus australis]
MHRPEKREIPRKPAGQRHRFAHAKIRDSNPVRLSGRRITTHHLIRNDSPSLVALVIAVRRCVLRCTQSYSLIPNTCLGVISPLSAPTVHCKDTSPQHLPQYVKSSTTVSTNPAFIDHLPEKTFGLIHQSYSRSSATCVFYTISMRQCLADLSFPFKAGIRSHRSPNLTHILKYWRSKRICRRGRGGVVARLLATHPGELGSIPDVIAPGCLQVGIVPDDAAVRRVFPGVSRFPHPCIPALLHTHLASPSSALETSMLTAAHISELHFTTLLYVLEIRKARVNLSCVRGGGGLVFVKGGGGVVYSANMLWWLIQQHVFTQGTRAVCKHYTALWRSTASMYRSSAREIITPRLHSTHGAGLSTIIVYEHGAAVMQWSDYLPPTTANWVASGFLESGNRIGRCRWSEVFLGISRFLCPCIPTLLHAHLAFTSSALKSRMLRAAISSFNTGYRRNSECERTFQIKVSDIINVRRASEPRVYESRESGRLCDAERYTTIRRSERATSSTENDQQEEDLGRYLRQVSQTVTLASPHGSTPPPFPEDLYCTFLPPTRPAVCMCTCMLPSVDAYTSMDNPSPTPLAEARRVTSGSLSDQQYSIWCRPVRFPFASILRCQPSGFIYICCAPDKSLPFISSDSAPLLSMLLAFKQFLKRESLSQLPSKHEQHSVVENEPRSAPPLPPSEPVQPYSLLDLSKPHE